MIPCSISQVDPVCNEGKVAAIMNSQRRVCPLRRVVRNPGNVTFSFSPCPFSSSSLLLQYPIQNLCIPKIAEHCEQCSNHLPLRQGSTSRHPSLFSKVMATEISSHFSFLLSSTGFDCFLCFCFCFSPISLLFQICDRPAAENRKGYTQFVATRIGKVNKR